MKIVNGKIIQPYDPRTVQAMRALLDRIPTTGTAEAAALVACRDLCDNVLDGFYKIEEVDFAQQADNAGTAASS